MPNIKNPKEMAPSLTPQNLFWFIIRQSTAVWRDSLHSKFQIQSVDSPTVLSKWSLSTSHSAIWNNSQITSVRPADSKDTPQVHSTMVINYAMVVYKELSWSVIFCLLAAINSSNQNPNSRKIYLVKNKFMWLQNHKMLKLLTIQCRYADFTPELQVSDSCYWFVLPISTQRALYLHLYSFLKKLSGWLNSTLQLIISVNKQASTLGWTSTGF